MSDLAARIDLAWFDGPHTDCSAERMHAHRIAPSEITGTVKSRPGAIIEVEWYDSERVMLGWATREEYIEALNERSIYRTSGYFVGEDSDHVMVSHSKSDAGNYSDAMVIPLAVVISVAELKAASE